MTRTLADMTPDERADCVGRWATFHGSVDPRPVIIWTVEGDIVWRLTFTSQLPIMGTDLDQITPRLDLPRVWTPSGEPVPGEWEESPSSEHHHRWCARWEQKPDEQATEEKK